MIQAKSYKDAFKRLKALLDSRAVDLDFRHWVIVPDDCTLTAERLLFCDGGAFDVEVLTFNRLFNKLAECADYLPRHGAVMLLKKVLKSENKSLKFFRKSALYKGFAGKLYDTINMLISNGIEPIDLNNLAEHDLKINDIKLVYEKYLHAAKGKFVDAAGRMKLLADKVKNTDFSNTTFYFAGFECFTHQQQNIIDAIAVSAAGIVNFVVGEPYPEFGAAEFYSAADEADQLKAAAKRIRTLVKNGTRYSDICIISPQISFEKTKRILSEFDIPFFIDQKIVLSEQPLAGYLMTLRRILDNGYSREDFIALAKNSFANIAKSESDEFENYVNKFCIDYKLFLKPFTLSGVEGRRNLDEERARLFGRLDAAENVREKLCRIIENFDAGRKTVCSAQDFFEFIITQTKDGLRSDIMAADVVCERIRQTAQILTRIYDGGAIGFDELFDLFTEGLNSVEISVLPKYDDVVTVGGCSFARANEYKYVFAIDFCEGIIPPYKEDLELISDADIDVLEGRGLILEPKVQQVNNTYTNDFIFSLLDAKAIFLGYSDVDNKRISELGPLIKQNCKYIKMSDITSETDTLYDYTEFMAARKNNDFDYIARNCSTKSNALELLLLSDASVREGEKSLPFASELHALFSGDEIEKFAYGSDDGPRILSHGASLYFGSNTTSITKMQDYFLCPYLAFLTHSLRLSEREDGKLSPLDIGSFLHKAAEDFIAKNDFAKPDHAMQLVVDKIVEQDEKWSLEQNRALIERLKSEAVELAPVLARQITGGQFVSKFFEKRFDNENENSLKSITLPVAGKEISLVGAIDRADFYGNYARVIDYKTGRLSGSDFSYADLFFGRKLQLLIYMAVLRANGYSLAGGFYFPLSSAWDDGEFSHRLKGIYNNDVSVITAMDHELQFANAKSTIINSKRKKAEPKILSKDDFHKCGYAFSEDELELLCEYAVKVLTKAAGEIAEGYIASSPFDRACEFCVYAAVCRKKGTVRTREKKSVKPEVIIKVLE